MDSSVKNMVTSLRAVGELQNPAIRDRHWEQLMQATQVSLSPNVVCLLENVIDKFQKAAADHANFKCKAHKRYFFVNTYHTPVWAEK